MTVAQAAAIARGASLGGFTYHLTRLTVYDASKIEVRFNGRLLKGITDITFDSGGYHQ